MCNASRQRLVRCKMVSNKIKHSPVMVFTSYFIMTSFDCTFGIRFDFLQCLKEVTKKLIHRKGITAFFKNICMLTFRDHLIPNQIFSLFASQFLLCDTTFVYVFFERHNNAAIEGYQMFFFFRYHYS